MQNRAIGSYDIYNVRDGIVKRIFNNDGEDDICIRNGNFYEVKLSNINFRCCYTENDIMDIADLCLELIEELREINISGYTRSNLVNVKKNIKDDTFDVERIMTIYRSFANQKTDEIFREIGDVARVGGAYYMILSLPTLISAVVQVFDRMMDKYDDLEDYAMSLFILIVMSMHMNCQEI